MSNLFEDQKGAVISHNGLFRYNLWRYKSSMDPFNVIGFIMLNPSTADADNDDPTIRRCLTRALKMGYSGIQVGNLYAYRTPNPQHLKEAGYPIGSENDMYLRLLANDTKKIILGWGNNAPDERAKEVIEMIRLINPSIYHLGLTKSGQPKHPLYIGYDIEPTRYECKSQNIELADG